MRRIEHSSTASVGDRGAAHDTTTLALLLAALAGGVDAVGWLTLDGLYVAHMSGNTVGLTTHIALGEWAEVGRRAFVIVAFLVGIGVGAAAGAYTAARARPKGFALALGIEALLLGTVLVLGVASAHGTHVVPREARGAYYLLVALGAMAMGLQSATLRRVGHARLRTTYVTGTLTRLVEALVRLSTLAASRRRGVERAGDAEARDDARTEARLLAAVWFSYAGGGVLSALLVPRVGFFALVVPLALLGLAATVDAARDHRIRATA